MKYENLFLDQERALYGIHDSEVVSCTFSGPADGESALKECRSLKIKDTYFDLRYPLWHLKKGVLERIEMTENCRAALWYDRNIKITSSCLHGIKALRECRNVSLSDCDIVSPEFGWFCRKVDVSGGRLQSEYPFLKSSGLTLCDVKMTGKYSFQYVKGAVLKNCILDTKDAFWHAENVRLENCIVKGEYTGWYSKNLTFVNCKIEGTQPLCYADGLVLENCEMQGADLAFENSDVSAVLHGNVISVKNPKSGCIRADHIGKIILDEYCARPCLCKIEEIGNAREKTA